MTKLMIIPNKKNINEMINQVDSILIGLDNYSVNFEDTFTLDEIKQINDKLTKTELFVALNKNIHNNELDNLKKILKKLDDFKLNGIFYYDICFVKLKKDLNLSTNLIWSQEHLTTNYGTIQFWNQYGVSGTYLSPDITLNEILEIKKHIDSRLIIPIFGYLPMFVSERHIVKNYMNYFHLKGDTKINYLKKEEKKYPIIDNELGTTVYADGILNGYTEFLELEKNNIDYVTLNTLGIENEIILKIIDIFQFKNKDGEKEIDELLKQNTSKHFLHQETIYRVKNHE